LDIRLVKQVDNDWATAIGLLFRPMISSSPDIIWQFNFTTTNY
jgi:hypothetical protein